VVAPASRGNANGVRRKCFEASGKHLRLRRIFLIGDILYVALVDEKCRFDNACDYISKNKQ
jgi:hypothetical protein